MVAAVCTVPQVSGPRIALVVLSPRDLDLLVRGRREALEHRLGLTLPADWPDAHDLRFLRYRRDQVRRDPRGRDWLVRLVVLPETGQMIGHAGFHGPPGVNCRDAEAAV